MKKLITFIILILILINSDKQSLAFDLAGKWMTVEPDKDRYRNVYIFRDDGHFEAFYCKIVESKYRIENNLLIITSLTPKVDPPVRKYVYNLEGDQLTLYFVNSEEPLTLAEGLEAVRLPEREINKEFPLVGRWHIKASEYPRVSHEYTENGTQLFMFQEVSFVRGIYAVVDNKLRIWPMTTKSPIEYDLSYNEAAFTISNEESKEKIFKRIY